METVSGGEIIQPLVGLRVLCMCERCPQHFKAHGISEELALPWTGQSGRGSLEGMKAGELAHPDTCCRIRKNGPSFHLDLVVEVWENSPKGMRAGGMAPSLASCSTWGNRPCCTSPRHHSRASP